MVEEQLQYLVLEERNQRVVSLKDAKPSTKTLVRFFKPCAENVNEAAGIPNTPLLSEIFHQNLLHWPSKVLFQGWGLPQKGWKEWVNSLAEKHGTIWKQTGIYDAIVSSIYEVPCNRDLVLGLSEYWCPDTNTFVFQWGESTITLEDTMILGGFPVLGEPVSSPRNEEKMMIEQEMEKKRAEMCRSRTKKAEHCTWMKHFMGKECEMEHAGFLSLWLSRYVFPSLAAKTVGRHVFPIAARLLRGDKIALAPAVLGSIYRDLRLLREGILASKETISVSGPFRLLQLWAFEHFPLLGPKFPNPLKLGEPRVARWHKLSSKVHNLPLVRSALQVVGNFEWRPYAADLENWPYPSYYKEIEQCLFVDASLDAELCSFFKCLQICELVGVGYEEDYFPHRVAVQFGFDQDLPSDATGFTFGTKNVKFFVTPRTVQPCASERYIKWWKQMMFTRKDALQGVLMKEKYSKIIRAVSSIKAGGIQKGCHGSIASKDPVKAMPSSQTSAKSSSEESHSSVIPEFCSKKEMQEFFDDSDNEFPSNIHAHISDNPETRSKNSSVKSKKSNADCPVFPVSRTSKNDTKLYQGSAKLDYKENLESVPPKLDTVTKELTFSDSSDDDNIPIGSRSTHGFDGSKDISSLQGFSHNQSKNIISSNSGVVNEDSRKRKSHNATEGILQREVKKEPADGDGKEVDGRADTAKKMNIERGCSGNEPTETVNLEEVMQENNFSHNRSKNVICSNSEVVNEDSRKRKSHNGAFQNFQGKVKKGPVDGDAKVDGNAYVTKKVKKEGGCSGNEPIKMDELEEVVQESKEGRRSAKGVAETTKRKQAGETKYNPIEIDDFMEVTAGKSKNLGQGLERRLKRLEKLMGVIPIEDWK